MRVGSAPDAPERGPSSLSLAPSLCVSPPVDPIFSAAEALKPARNPVGIFDALVESSQEQFRYFSRRPNLHNHRDEYPRRIETIERSSPLHLFAYLNDEILLQETLRR
jgi:hypothetical protein